MDNTGLEIFDSLMEKPIRRQKYLNDFPQGGHEDRISELIWGVKSKTPNPNNIYRFVISNIMNSQKLLVNHIISPVRWQAYFNGILKNPGLMCEYFLVDYLSRNSHEYEHHKGKRFKFLHKKGTPEQDEVFKIDFITSLTTKAKSGKYSSINFGIQLTTSKSRAVYGNPNQKGSILIDKKKKDILRTSNKIDEGNVDNFRQSYIPDSMCLLVVNSSINEFINIEQINIFSNAFRTWQNEGYLPGGPTQYLNNIVKKDLEKINDGYHLGLELLYSLVPDISINNKDMKKIEKYDNFDILLDYNSSEKELKMDYFLKDGSFLMSLFFIINDKLVTKING
ncbi:MAG: hypothetical protein PHZ26_02295 [Candidatus Gracilibacteria bacterium]|nr:hypothetical protein [Candidatus Gracilibacteria bacterium]MDD2908565.1 hypothetical protein [Candidatus Gracilibacteria bacterium]